MPKPFLKAVFLEPIHRTDPSGRRLREAVKRMQLIAQATVARLHLLHVHSADEELFNHRVAGPLLVRVSACWPAGLAALATRLFTDDELTLLNAMLFEELAEDAVAAKYN